MKNVTFSNSLKTGAQVILLLAIPIFSLGALNVNIAYAEASSGANSGNTACGQLLADAEAQFLNTLSADGSVPASPETRAAAQEYIRVAKLCYEEIEAQDSAGSLQGDTPTFIDDGGVILGSEGSAEFALTGSKWGSSTPGTSGGTVTYSFMGNGISLSAEGYGNSVAVTSLPNFQTCFITDIQNAFAAWQAVASIQFVQVTDSGTAFNAAGATGDIRIGAHAFDGASGTLAHAYYPPPNGNSAAGDMHFDSAENWTCNTSGIDIGIVALHEIGHALGLGHEDTGTVAMMDPYYNPGLTTLQNDDINGSTALYGSAALSAPPGNDNWASPTTISGIPYTNSIDVSAATTQAGEPAVNVLCDNKLLRLGNNTVWYKFTPVTSKLISFDTVGSDYDTYIAIWTGNALNNLTLVGCDDDNALGFTSLLSLDATAGVTYYIQVAKYNGTQSGSPDDTPCPCNLVLNVRAQTFLDVPNDHWAWRYVEGLFNAGVTSGCNTSPSLYCPDVTVTRDQMAVFLLRGKHGSGYAPPPVGATSGFNDVPINYWAAAWIKQLAAEGITGGCGNGNYCPSLAVTRDQMAVFLLRAKYGIGYSPPAAIGMFTDVPTNHWAAAWIEQLASEGITSGCAAQLYCPATPVSRDQMAVFLTRTFNLPLP